MSRRRRGLVEALGRQPRRRPPRAVIRPRQVLPINHNQRHDRAVLLADLRRPAVDRSAGDRQQPALSRYRQRWSLAAIAHLGKAEHPLDDPDRMFDPGPHFGLGPIFRALDLIRDTAVPVAAIDEILGLWGLLPDHRPLTAVSLITPRRVSLPCRYFG